MHKARHHETAARGPNFAIIGAPKCGTTSLASWLADHNNVFISGIKEPHFYATDLRYRRIETQWAYDRLFDDVRPQHRAIAEASTGYLFSQVAVPAMEVAIPGIRYIVMLRNPIDMAYALHEQQVRSFNEDVTDFGVAWHLASERRSGRKVPARCADPVRLDYPSWSKLGTQLERLYSLVPRDRVHVVLLDDVKANPRREYLRVLEYLDLPDDGRVDFPVHNQAREWRSKALARSIRTLARGVGWAKHVSKVVPRRSLGIIKRARALNVRERPRPAMTRELHSIIAAYLAEDIVLLERLLRRDLSEWRARAPTAR